MRILPGVMACAAFCGMAAATTFEGPVSGYVPVALTPEERREVEQRVCQGPHHLPVAYAMGRSTDKIDHSAMMIEVRCAPHARVRGHAVSHQAICSNKDGPLKCEPSREVLIAMVRGQQWRLTVQSAVMTMSEAFELALFVDASSSLSTVEGDGYGDETTEIAKCDIQRHAADVYDLMCGSMLSMRVRALRSAGGIAFQEVDLASPQ